MENSDTGRWILLPGTLCTGAVFDPVLDSLGVSQGARHTVPITRESVEDYASFLEQAVRPGDIVCGFSLGAIVASRNLGSLQHARAIILIGLNPHADHPERAAGRLALQQGVESGRAREAIRETWVPTGHAHDMDMLGLVENMAVETAPHVAAQTQLALNRPSALELLEQCHVPLIVVAGSNDRAAPPHHARDTARAAPNSVLSILEGLGHFSLLEDPDLVAEAIVEGIQHTDPGALRQATS